MSRTLIFIIAAVLLAACGDAGWTQYPQSTAATGTGGVIAQATEDTYRANNSAATLQAEVARQTEVAETATRQVEEWLQGTADTAQAQAQGTAVVIQATEYAVNSQSTTQALAGIATANAAVFDATSTIVAAQAAAVSTSQAVWAEAQVRMVDEEAERLEIANRAEGAAITRSYILLGGLLFIALLVVGTVAYLRIYNAHQFATPVTVGDTILVNDILNGWMNASPPLIAAPPSRPLLAAGAINPQPATVSFNRLVDRADGIVLGAAENNQVVTIDLARTPHLFAAGMSGSGKTRRLLRPLIAQALAEGYFVVFMNESGADFSPFYDHPNVSIIRGDVYAYMRVLQTAIKEMEEREAILRQTSISEWRRLPQEYIQERPLMLLAIDELLALSTLLPPGEQRQFWGLLAAYASRARKVGMGSVGLATDPTMRALGQGGLTYRSQCGRVAFRMIQAHMSRAVLDVGGAEALEEGQFMALLDRPGIIHGTAPHPSDDELTTYLDSHTAETVAVPHWVQLPAAPERPSPAQSNELQTLLEEKRPEIEREYWRYIRDGDDGGDPPSQRYLERTLFGYNGGRAFDVVSAVLEEMRRDGRLITEEDEVDLISL